MEFKTIGTVTMPVLGVGTWGMGGKRETITRDDAQSIQAIKNATSLGMYHIDTAELYGNGHTEELVGQAIQGIPREKLFITTKVMGEHLHHDQLIDSATKSLRRLQTDYIDLYLIHYPNPQVPITETMDALNELMEQGKIRHIGLSNFSYEEMLEAIKHAKNPILTHQLEYNLIVRNHGAYEKHMESKVIPYCQENGIFVTAYRPFGRGELVRPGIPVLDEMVKKYNKTHSQVALNWLLSKKNIITIPKATSIDHIRSNLGALGWKLDPEDVKRLDTEIEVDRMYS